MSVVVRLNHRQFKDLLEEAKTEYGNLVYFCGVRWLSYGSMLKQIFDLRKPVYKFLCTKGKGEEFRQFKDESWVSDLAFFVNHLTII